MTIVVTAIRVSSGACRRAVARLVPSKNAALGVILHSPGADELFKLIAVLACSCCFLFSVERKESFPTVCNALFDDCCGSFGVMVAEG